MQSFSVGAMIVMLIFDYGAHSARAVEYTDCISADGVRNPQMSVQDMTLNNLMVGFQ